MNKLHKVVLSIPSILVLIAIPYNFFSDLGAEDYDMYFNILIVIQILYLIGFIYIIIKLWKDERKTKNTKWTWTFLMLLCIQPITTLIYLWAVEPQESNK